jgi:hypothetical protein
MGTRQEQMEPFTLSQGLLREGWEEAVADILSRRIFELRREPADTKRTEDPRPEEE